MRYGLLLLFLLLGTIAHAQVPYGNEWIRPAQQYLRLGTTQDGWYRLNAPDLAKQGFDLTKIPAQSLQLFRRGQEVAIQVNGEADGRLDATDYLEFYGQRNDGLLDTLLYVQPELMPQPHYSLYSDTATYFLTWRLDGLPGKRIASLATNVSKPTATYHQEKVLQVLAQEFSAGVIYPLGAGGDDGYLNTFGDTGTGWTGYIHGSNIWAGALGLPTEDPLRERFSEATLDILFVGRFAGVHLVEIWTGTDLKPKRKLGEITWQNYDTKTFKTSLLPEDLDSAGQVLVTFVPRGTNDRVSASYLSWTYPQRLSAFTKSTQKVLYVEPKNIANVDSARNARFFDISNPRVPRQLAPQYEGEIAAISAAERLPVLVVRKPLSVIGMRPVRFHTIDSVATDYLIITHPLVRKAVAESTDPVADYAAYRASAAGGGFTPLVIDAPDIFDQFNYGEPGPNGMRRLMRWLHDRAKLKYVFLVGQSRSPQIVRKKATARAEDMVPSAGWPDSDLALGMALDPADPYTPLVPIGRLNAYRAQNVWDYFQKVKEHEAAPAAAPWRKNVLHLSGGRSASELIQFRNFTDAYADEINSFSVAPALRTISKKTDEYIERFPIAPIINEGVALMTLYGHSSLNITDIEIGEVSKDAFGYRNQGRYPAVIVNGCALGNFYFAGPPTSTDWIMTPKRGAVLFVAHTHLGFTAALHQHSTSFYEALADPAFTSRGFGDIMREGIRRTMLGNPSLSDRVTAQQMGLQGDPAIKIFPATRPDYTWVPATVSVTNRQGQKISASDDSLRIIAQVANYGRLLGKNYSFSILRKKEGRVLASYRYDRPAVALRDSLVLLVPNVSRQGGDETWEFRIDPDNLIAEEDETNNAVSTQIQIAEGGATPLLPSDGSVFVQPKIELVAQIPAGRVAQWVIFEYSEDPKFGTPTKLDSVKSDAILVKKSIELIGQNPRTIYWRVRLAGDAATASRMFRYDPKGTNQTSPLPEGVAASSDDYPQEVDEGNSFKANVSFENITDVPFTDSIRVAVRHFYENRVSESTLMIPPLAARRRYALDFSEATQRKSGFHRILVSFNTKKIPEQLYANNIAELIYTVAPDRSPPLLDVMVDEHRLADGEAVAPRPVIQVHLLDSNPYSLHSDTTGIKVDLWNTCSQCPETPIPLQKASATAESSADFGADYDFGQLAPGTYRLRVTGRDLAGNAAAPYEIHFRVAEINRVISATASPNPADFWVKFSLELEGKNAPELWRVRVYDLNGKSIVTLQEKPNLGGNEIFWIPAGVASGMYLYRMELVGEDWPEKMGSGKALLR